MGVGVEGTFLDVGYYSSQELAVGLNVGAVH